MGIKAQRRCVPMSGLQRDQKDFKVRPKRNRKQDAHTGLMCSHFLQRAAAFWTNCRWWTDFWLRQVYREDIALWLKWKTSPRLYFSNDKNRTTLRELQNTSPSLWPSFSSAQVCPDFRKEWTSQRKTQRCSSSQVRGSKLERGSCWTWALTLSTHPGRERRWAPSILSCTYWTWALKRRAPRNVPFTRRLYAAAPGFTFFSSLFLQDKVGFFIEAETFKLELTCLHLSWSQCDRWK